METEKAAVDSSSSTTFNLEDHLEAVNYLLSEQIVVLRARHIFR